jgi:RNA polymerase sigma factor (sigma-70 family)
MTSEQVGLPGDGLVGTSAAGPAVAGLSMAGANLGELFRVHHCDLVRLSVALLQDRATAEDVVQDVFAAVQARHGDLLRADDALRYLRVAVVNRSRSVLRRQAVGRRLGLMRDRDLESVYTHSAEADAITAESRGEVLAALAALPPRRREVLVLRYYLGLSEAEIASMLGISQGTVKSTTARGLAAVAKTLGEKS